MLFLFGLRVVGTVAALAGSGAAQASTCPAQWVQNHGVCLWPKQQAYHNMTVSDAGACCGACASSDRCVSWLFNSAPNGRIPANTCILNGALIKGQAPSSPSCTSGSRPTPPPPPTPKPNPAKKGAKNVLFFAVDDLRPEITSFGPIPGTVSPPMHTPNFDALAGTSLVLLKNYVQQAVCSPTRASLLTGRRPDRTRTYDLTSYFRVVAANYTTIPEFFLHNGYKTVGMGKIFHPGAASGMDDSCCSWSNGSDYFHAPNLKYWSGTAANAGGAGGASWMSVSPAAEAKMPLPDNQTADHAIATLVQLEAEHAAGDTRPFFLAVGFHKPHLPFIASDQFFEPYAPAAVQLPPDQDAPEGMPEVAWSSWGELRAYSDIAPLNNSGAPGDHLQKQDTLALRRAYYASVTQTDAMLGKVMRALKASPFYDNTVISIWGDHGWQLGEHGEWCKHTNFEFATRAPMMIRVPGLTDAGIRTTHYTEHVDLFPTLAEAAAEITLPVCPHGAGSFDVALCTEGSSLVPLMHDPGTPVKQASFSQYPRGYVSNPGTEVAADILAPTTLGGKPSVSLCILEAWPHDPTRRGCTMGYTMVTQVDGCEYRYTEWADFNTVGFDKRVNWDRNVGVELYNHTADPGENFNINATHPGSFVVAALSARLSAQLRAGPTYGP